MKKLLIATGNPAKLEMFKTLLTQIDDIELLTLKDFEKIEEPIEDGKTVADNAFIKAKYYSDKFGIPALADDAGFSIPDLGGAPGVKARRWGGELPNSVSDEDYLEFLLNKLQGIDKELIEASFPFSRCLYLPNNTHFFQNESIDILLSKMPRRPYKKGWPVSSIAVFSDGRHHLDVPDDDEFLVERLKKEGLLELLKKL